MVTREDLKTVSSHVEPTDLSEWRHVEYNGQRFILISTELTEDVIMNVMQEDPAFGFFLMFQPEKDTAVFRADENWQIIGPECSEECAEGVCTRRVASNSKVADIELGYKMLLDYLNA
jgi:hypothetical protein